MYRMDEMELWSQRRHELAREVEGGRLSGQTKDARSWRALFARMLEFSLRPHAESGGRA